MIQCVIPNGCSRAVCVSRSEEPLSAPTLLRKHLSKFTGIPQANNRRSNDSKEGKLSCVFVIELMLVHIFAMNGHDGLAVVIHVTGLIHH